MSSLKKTPVGASSASRRLGYSGIEVLSDGSGGSGEFVRCKLNSERLPVPGEDGRAMSEVSSYHSMSQSIKKLPISVDVTSAHQSRAAGYKSIKLYKKSFISTLVTFVMLVIGIILVATLRTNDKSNIKTNGYVALSHVIRAAGLFGFAGGLTNWVGIQIIFNRMPRLLCRGVLAKQFTVARENVANFLLEAFFSPFQVQQHVHDKTQEFLDPEQFEQYLHRVLSSDDVLRLIDQKLGALMATPEGLTLRNLGLSKVKLRTLVKRYILDMNGFASSMILSSIHSSDLVNAEKIRQQIVDLIATRTQQMTTEQLKQFVHDALYKHVLWLVLWGNVFGAIVGCVVEIASIYTRDLPW